MRRRAGWAAVTFAAVAAAAPAVGQAATTIGQAPPTDGTLQDCTSGGQTLDAAQLATATGNGYVVPAGGGVITSWTSTITGTGTVRLRVFDPSSTTAEVTPVAQSDAIDLATAQPGPHPTRIPVKGGEPIGFALNTTNSHGCIAPGGSNGNVITIGPYGAIGQPQATSGPMATTLINMAATVEPDADGDGYGDETQDSCPTDPTAHENCSAAFTVGKTKRNTKKGTATISIGVPGAGVLKLTGKYVAPTTKAPAAAGEVTLNVKPRGNAKRQLKRNGKANVRVLISYTAANSTEPIETSANVKLKRK